MISIIKMCWYYQPQVSSNKYSKYKAMLSNLILQHEEKLPLSLNVSEHKPNFFSHAIVQIYFTEDVTHFSVLRLLIEPMPIDLMIINDSNRDQRSHPFQRRSVYIYNSSTFDHDDHY
jgi:hypothetical protein